VSVPAKFSFDHVNLLVTYAYSDALPRLPASMKTDESIRAFLRDCVVPLAPEHERRITELLISARIKTPSRFASDMRAAFRVCDSAADDDDDNDDEDLSFESDVRVQLRDGRVVHAHRAILSAASAFFQSLFRKPSVFVADLADCDAALALAVIEFAYCGECAWSELDMIELVRLARKLAMGALVARCELLLISAVERSNAEWLGQFAQELGLVRLLRVCEQRKQR
jgi:hypothetical protein